MPTRPAGGFEAAARILLIDGDAAGRRQLADNLGGCGVAASQITEAGCGCQAAELLKRGAFDIVLADLTSLGDLATPVDDAVARLVKHAEGALLVALSEAGSVSAAMAAMRAGAHDFIAKPIGGASVVARLGELAQRHGKARALTIGAERHQPAAGLAGFIGASSQMQFVYEQIERIAPSSAPVFITGESGTGKSACAEALHQRGPRAGRPFVTISCAGISRERLDGELFGTAAGGYSAAAAHRGAAELADGGTLFIDEIGEMDLSLQGKLLRFLQTGAISRIGEVGLRQVDVRVICATRRNPMQLIADKKFREDLFYRLHVLPIHLPPLRQRPADIMALARHFLRDYAQAERKRLTGFAPEAANFLVARDWPGNVRQLQSFIRRLAVLCDGDEVSVEMVAASEQEARGALPGPLVAGHEPKRHAIEPMWRQEQRIIEDAVSRFSGNIALAAAALEISPSTIYRKRQAWAEMDGRKGAA